MSMDPFFLFVVVVGPMKEKIKYFKMNRSTKRFVFLKNYNFRSYMSICFQLVAFVKGQIWHQAIRMEHKMRLKLYVSLCNG